MNTEDDDQAFRAADVTRTLMQGAAVARRKPNGKRKQEPAFERTDVAMADALVRRCKRELRYCAALGGWHHWTGTHWAEDEQEHATECIKAMAREIAEHAAGSFDPGLLRDAKRIGSGPGAQSILKFARSAPEVVFTPADANRDPWLLNTRNGTIDLRTAELRGPRPGRLDHALLPGGVRQQGARHRSSRSS